MDLGGMTPQHVLYIPMVGMIFLMIGYAIGSRTVRAEYEKQKKRMRE